MGTNQRSKINHQYSGECTQSTAAHLHFGAIANNVSDREMNVAAIGDHLNVKLRLAMALAGHVALTLMSKCRIYCATDNSANTNKWQQITAVNSVAQIIENFKIARNSGK